MKCPKCNNTNHMPGARFCAICGTPLDKHTEPSASPAAINLGLPSGTLWASCNVGTTKPEEYGGYYAWGETEEKQVYSWNTYSFCSNGEQNTCQTIGKCVRISNGEIGYDISGTEYDVAHVKWGGNWQMPTAEQVKELVECCSHEWTSLNGIAGERITGPNGNSIFLPAAKWRFGSELYAPGNGCYWAGFMHPKHFRTACNLGFTPLGMGWTYEGCYRYVGHTVRPVMIP